MKLRWITEDGPVGCRTCRTALQRHASTFFRCFCSHRQQRQQQHKNLEVCEEGAVERVIKLDRNAASRTHYDTLEVAQNATHDEIRQNYRKLILLHHPDKQRKLQEHNDVEKQAEALNVAYAVLSDAVSRAEYDLTLQDKQAVQQSNPASAVSHIVSLSDFTIKDSNGVETYYFPSRCGGEFKVDTEALEDGDGDLLLECEGCTERIRVTYDFA